MNQIVQRIKMIQGKGREKKLIDTFNNQNKYTFLYFFINLIYSLDPTGRFLIGEQSSGVVVSAASIASASHGRAAGASHGRRRYGAEHGRRFMRQLPRQYQEREEHGRL